MRPLRRIISSTPKLRSTLAIQLEYLQNEEVQVEKDERLINEHAKKIIGKVEQQRDTLLQQVRYLQYNQN